LIVTPVHFRKRQFQSWLRRFWLLIAREQKLNTSRELMKSWDLSFTWLCRIRKRIKSVLTRWVKVLMRWRCSLKYLFRLCTLTMSFVRYRAVFVCLEYCSNIMIQKFVDFCIQLDAHLNYMPAHGFLQYLLIGVHESILCSLYGAKYYF
jgi:hypothetical protein